MGCDIHIHAEVKVNGRWEYFGEHSFGRYYTAFGYMANCHRSEIDPVVPNKGIPHDINPLTKLYMDDVDYHSHSWLDKEELAKVCQRFRDHGKPNVPQCERCIARGDIEQEDEGEDLTFFANFIENIFEDIKDGHTAVLDYRLVFAFDN